MLCIQSSQLGAIELGENRESHLFYIHEKLLGAVAPGGGGICSTCPCCIGKWGKLFLHHPHHCGRLSGVGWGEGVSLYTHDGRRQGRHVQTNCITCSAANPTVSIPPYKGSTKMSLPPIQRYQLVFTGEFIGVGPLAFLPNSTYSDLERGGNGPPLFFANI